MNLAPGLFDHTYAIFFRFFHFLSPEQAMAALLLSVSLAVVNTVIHELGHLGAAKYFGVPAAIRLFPKRAEQGAQRRFWLLGPLGVVADDDHFFALARWKRRVIIGAGPGIDAVVGILCLLHGLTLPTALWVAVSVALTGSLVVFIGMPINLIPIRCLQNDGWLLFNPYRQDTKR